ncbi:MAG: DUF2892 domain-containing protein [Peptococcaceae bacterium]|nr:DUF2892 domain-containing protein [Peptococcaceae bacterium]
MKVNEGSLERVIRFIVGVVVLSLWFVLSGNAKYFALLGLIPLLTGLMGFCPLYALFGFSTTGKNN